MDRVQRKNLRMEGYDYSTVGYYFVTVVTVGCRELFGRVVGGRFLPNDAGAMVGRCINDLETRFKGLEVLNSAVMPNHDMPYCSIITDSAYLKLCGSLRLLLRVYTVREWKLAVGVDTT